MDTDGGRSSSRAGLLSSVTCLQGRAKACQSFLESLSLETDLERSLGVRG